MIASYFLPYRKAAELQEEAAAIESQMAVALIEANYYMQEFKIESRALKQSIDTSATVNNELIEKLDRKFDQLMVRDENASDSLRYAERIAIDIRIAQLSNALLKSMNAKNIPAGSTLEQRAEKLQGLVESLRRVGAKTSKLMSQNRLMESKLKMVTRFVIAGWVGGALGLLLGVAGFWLWFTRVQRYLDAQIANGEIATPSSDPSTASEKDV